MPETVTLHRQPEVNIGTIGHVDHGKTTLVQAITGIWAAKHSEELKRGITIKLGYADAPIYKCPSCESPQCYCTKRKCPKCGDEAEFIRAVSFVDAPGHEALMATMLSGASIMDGAILVIAANEKCPQPQTREHLAALEVVGIKNIIIAQNKIDIVNEKRAIESYQEIMDFVKGTIAENAPIIPISAQHGMNVDVVLQTIEKYIPTPKRNPSVHPLMYVVRSFDVNKPRAPIEKLRGGVIGGSVYQGVFQVEDEIQISPGIRMEKHGKPFYELLASKVESLHAGGRKVDEVTSGGLVGVGTLLDPSITKADGLAGNLVGKPDELPPTLYELNMETFLFERAIGTKELLEVGEIKRGETLLLDIATAITIAKITNLKGNTATLQLTRPICAEKGFRGALSRKIGGRWRLIGYGILT